MRVSYSGLAIEARLCGNVLSVEGVPYMSDRLLFGVAVIGGIIVMLLGIFLKSFISHESLRNLRLLLIVIGLIIAADGGYGLIRHRTA